MKIDLSNLPTKAAIEPPRIVVYGPPKIGKSHFASQAPGIVFAECERGLDFIVAPRQRVTNWAELLDFVTALRTQPHEFATAAFDTLDYVEQFIFDQVALENNVKTINDVGYGKGYVQAVNMWRYLLDQLDALRSERKVAILFIAHDLVKKYEDPLRESYDRHLLRMHEKSSAVVSDWADCILFANHRVNIKEEKGGFNKKVAKALDAGKILSTTDNPAFMAGNRINLPSELPLQWKAFLDAYTSCANQQLQQ